MYERNKKLACWPVACTAQEKNERDLQLDCCIAVQGRGLGAALSTWPARAGGGRPEAGRGVVVIEVQLPCCWRVEISCWVHARVGQGRVKERLGAVSDSALEGGDAGTEEPAAAGVWCATSREGENDTGDLIGAVDMRARARTQEEPSHDLQRRLSSSGKQSNTPTMIRSKGRNGKEILRRKGWGISDLRFEESEG